MKQTTFLTRNFTGIVIIGALAFVSALFWNPHAKNLTQPNSTAGVKVRDLADRREDLPPRMREFGLIIPKLDLKAPIIPDVDGYNEGEYFKALLSGVAQFKGYSNPDETGNLFIFGHSSSSDWRGDYKRVFKELNKLARGDKITVYYQGVAYQYEVFKSFETNATDWSIADPTPTIQGDRTLTLMTCFPPRTIKNRWAVFARQI